MKLLYRADGGHPIGTGHLFRAVRLIRELYKHPDVEITLAAAREPAAERIVADAPARILWLPPRTSKDAVKPELQAGPLLEALPDSCFDLVAVDMLDTDASEVEQLRTVARRIVTFDDRGDGRLKADGIINILVTEPAPNGLPNGVKLFEGGQYAVLDQIFKEAHRSYDRPIGDLKRVFVTLGGADAAALAVKTARSLVQIPELEQVEFAVGPAFPHREALESVLTAAPWKYNILVGLPSLLEPYVRCDLAIVAGGLTMYEVMCVGVPSLAVCQPIDHQFEMAERFSAVDAMDTVGYGTEASEDQIAQAVRRLMADTATRTRMSQMGPTVTDGRGGERVAEILMELA